jgi:hypothetical protein
MRITTASVAATVWLLVSGCANGAPQAPTAKPPSPRPEIEVLRVPWKFTIQDLECRTIGLLTVRFTDEKAESCMSGDWKRVVVVEFESTGEPGFPGGEPLAYTVDGGSLIVGRNEICDAYVWLSGDLKKDGLTGDYFSLGLGGRRPRGYVLAKPLVGVMSPNTALKRTREK